MEENIPAVGEIGVDGFTPGCSTAQPPSSSSPVSSSSHKLLRLGEEDGTECCIPLSSSRKPISNFKTEDPKRRTGKKPGKEQRTGYQTSSRKAKKESLRERISALQQLVSPFGKSDTASVLQEAVGYIKFLHNQIQLLSSPFLHRLPSSGLHRENEDAERRSDALRSWGLCLVPAPFMASVEGSNGADFWSSAMEGSSYNPTSATYKSKQDSTSINQEVQSTPQGDSQKN